MKSAATTNRALATGRVSFPKFSFFARRHDDMSIGDRNRIVAFAGIWLGKSDSAGA